MTGADRSLPGRPIGFAHRGGAGAPDNTIAAFSGALAAGATALETDAWLTADGQVVLDHDGVLRVALLRREPMASVTRDELPAHIPTLDDLYDACGTDFDLAVDVKHPDIADALARVAHRRGAAERLWVVAPHSALLAELPFGNPAVTVKAATLRGPRRTPVVAALRDAGVKALNARWPWWSRSYVDQVHEAGLLAFGYDAQRERSLQRCLDLGLDAVFSDQVELMVAVLGAEG